MALINSSALSLTCLASSLKYRRTYIDPTALARLPLAAPTQVRHLWDKTSYVKALIIPNPVNCPTSKLKRA